MDYQIGSVRAKSNVLSIPNEHVPLRDRFLDVQNMLDVASHLYKTYRNIGGTSSTDKFKKAIYQLAMRFVKQTDFSQYRNVDYHATNTLDYAEIMPAINNAFINMVHDHFKWNTMVPTRASYDVGSATDRRTVSGSSLSAMDANTIDLWANTNIQIVNSHFRDANRIPFYQRTMNNRHYDRDNYGQGLRHNNADEASLNNMTRQSYDMSNIRKTVNKWESKEWFGM